MSVSLKPSEKNKDFFLSVYEVVRLIPKGRVTSYGAIANYIGAKNGARMVGWAMNNSHSQEKYVPAHRVVNRIGMLSGKGHFQNPTAMQEALEEEGHFIKKDQIMNFEEVFWDPSKELEL